MYRKLKAINPDFRLIEMPSDDVPDNIKSRTYQAANFKVYIRREWMVVVVQDASSVYCTQSPR